METPKIDSYLKSVVKIVTGYRNTYFCNPQGTAIYGFLSVVTVSGCSNFRFYLGKTYLLHLRLPYWPSAWVLLFDVAESIKGKKAVYVKNYILLPGRTKSSQLA